MIKRLASVGAAVLLMSAAFVTPATAAPEPKGIETLPADPVEGDLAIQYSYDNGSDTPTVLVMDNHTGKVLADISDKIADHDVIISEDGKVTEDPSSVSD